MKNDIIEILKKEKTLLKQKFGVEEIAVFGSYARGDETPESDVDILVKLKEIKFANLAGLYLYLEEKLRKKIDLIRKGPHLSERFLKIISKDIIYV